MKANELQIGDWVDRFNTLPYYKVIAVDNTTTEVTISQTGNDDDTKRICLDDKLDPIPLTPEILARMGFTIEEVPKYDDAYTEDEYIATIKCVDSRKCEVEIEYKTYWKKLRAFNHDPHNRLGFTSIETQIEYVHELQHIMRLCGIEKTIEL